MASLWFTIPEAARLQHVHKELIYRAIRSGDIRCRRFSARRSMVWYPDVTEWADGRRAAR